jgi:hypothetical protein
LFEGPILGIEKPLLQNNGSLVPGNIAVRNTLEAKTKCIEEVGLNM